MQSKTEKMVCCKCKSITTDTKTLGPWMCLACKAEVQNDA